MFTFNYTDSKKPQLQLFYGTFHMPHIVIRRQPIKAKGFLFYNQHHLGRKNLE